MTMESKGDLSRGESWHELGSSEKAVEWLIPAVKLI